MPSHCEFIMNFVTMMRLLQWLVSTSPANSFSLFCVGISCLNYIPTSPRANENIIHLDVYRTNGHQELRARTLTHRHHKQQIAINWKRGFNDKDYLHYRVGTSVRWSRARHVNAVTACTGMRCAADENTRRENQKLCAPVRMWSGKNKFGDDILTGFLCNLVILPLPRYFARNNY